jgi:hypothetical protein
MLNKFFKIFLLLSFLCTISIFSNDAEEDNNLESKLEWEPVKLAKGYHVQIRNNNKKLIVDEKINENKYFIKLPEGNYEERIGVYNKFGKISGYSDWQKIIINKVYNPQIDNNKISIQNDISIHKLIIKGNFFTSDTKVILKSEKEKIIITEQNFKSEKEIEVTIYVENSTSGIFDLIIINPRNKKSSSLEYLSIVDKNINLAQLNERSIEKGKISSLIPEKKAIYYGVRSAILPGFGQFHKNQKVKSGVYAFAFLGSLYYLETLVSAYSENKKQYDNSSNLGVILGFQTQNFSNGLILYNFNQTNQYLSQAESKGLQATQVFSVVSLIYLVNVFDAIYSKTNDEISIKPGLQFYSDYKIQSVSPYTPLNSQVDIGLKWNF